MTLFVSSRDFTLRTTSGHTIAFKRNEPIEVPPVVQSEAMKFGCVPVDAEAFDVEVMDAERAQPVRVEDDLRRCILFTVIEEVVARNNFREFDSAGRPHVKFISKRSGFDVSVQERDKLWVEYRQTLGEGSKLPTHKATKIYLDIVGVDSRKTLNEYADELKVDRTLIDGASVDQARQIVLRAAIKQAK